MPPTITTLVTGIWSTSAQSVVKGFRRQQEFEVTIVGTGHHAEDETAGVEFCDHYEQTPDVTQTSAYVDALVSLSKEYDVDLLVPLNEGVMASIHESSNAFEDTELLLSEPSTIEICNDKVETATFFESVGVETPKTVFQSPDASREELVDALEYPLIAKPRFGVSSRGVYEIRDESELNLLDRLDEPVVQDCWTELREPFYPEHATPIWWQ